MEARGAGLSPSLAASFSKLTARGADVQPPAAGNRAPLFSVYTGRSSRAGIPGAQGGWTTWAPGPRRGGQAAAPRTQEAPNPKHTRAHAGQSLRRRSRKALPQLFIHSSKGEVPFARAPPSRDPRGLQGGQLRHDPPPIRPQPPHPLHPHAHPQQTRPPSGSPASPPRRGRCLPGSPQLRRPAAPASRPRAAQTCHAQAGQGCRRRDAPAALESSRLRSRARALGGGRGRKAGRMEEEAGSKSSGRSGPAAPPSPPRPAPAVPHPGTRSHRRWRLGTPATPPPLPRAAAGLEPGVGRQLRARVRARIVGAHLPAPGRA